MRTAPLTTTPHVEPGGQEAPRLGFLGVGWIGRNRMEAIAASGAGRVAAITDPSPAMRDAASAASPGADPLDSFDALLDAELDGLVIATPSALHAEQAIRALEHGLAVFCQKPLGRTADETQRVVDAARAADRLLGVDLSYRHTAAMARLREIVRAGEIGSVYAAELVFHNAYGPDKPWFRDPELSGGGCVIDLGIHLVDLALWTLGFPEVESVSSRLFTRGAEPTADAVEDYALASLDLAGGTAARIACSWSLHAGQDAVIEATFYGTESAVRMRNVDGSFYDFVGEHMRGTGRTTLVEPPDDWGGRAAVAWARQLSRSPAFDPAIETVTDVARVLDRIYAR